MKQENVGRVKNTMHGFQKIEKTRRRFGFRGFICCVILWEVNRPCKGGKGFKSHSPSRFPQSTPTDAGVRKYAINHLEIPRLAAMLCSAR